MEEPVGTNQAPWHLWVVGILGLLWNGFGGYDYYMSQTANEEHIAAMTEPFGFEAEVATQYFASFPLWADAAWALGVWGSIAGSLLLLLRSRFAFHAFAASIIGLVLAMFYQFGNPIPGLTDSAMTMVFTVCIVILILLQTWYAKRMTARGVLR